MDTILAVQIILIAIITALLIWRRRRKQAMARGGTKAEPFVPEGRDNDLIRLSNPILARYWNHEHLSEPERVFLYVWELEGEVNNGGFDQYYFNTDGDHCLLVAQALEAIGALQAASIVRRSNALFGCEGPSPDRFERQRQLDQLPEQAKAAMEDLDHEFFRYPDDLAALLRQYVLSHDDDFRLQRQSQ